MLKFIYDRYVAAGGGLDFQAFQNPISGLVSITIVDGDPVITRWDEDLEKLGVKRPTDKELAKALNTPASIDEERALMIALLTDRCAKEITGGYFSNALGEDHLYPSDETAQRNMMGSFLEALIPGLPDDWTTPFWCADKQRQWEFRDHTAAQIIAAGRSGKAHVIACQSNLATRAAQVMAAKTVEGVSSITW